VRTNLPRRAKLQNQHTGCCLDDSLNEISQILH
jgi:hypothetical protein